MIEHTTKEVHLLLQTQLPLLTLPRCSLSFLHAFGVTKGVFLVMTKNVFLPIKRVYSVNTYL